jgi:FAD dependent oxidoreductase
MLRVPVLGTTSPKNAFLLSVAALQGSRSVVDNAELFLRLTLYRVRGYYWTPATTSPFSQNGGLPPPILSLLKLLALCKQIFSPFLFDDHSSSRSLRWEWPPAVCGKHTNLDSLDKSKRWCMTSYRILEDLMKIVPAKEHGIRMRMSNFFFHKTLPNMPDQLEKMLEIESVPGVRTTCINGTRNTNNQPQIRGFKHDPSIISKLAVNQQAGVVDAYRHLAPVIDTDQYMLWLGKLVASKRGRFITTRISGDLLAQEDRLLAKYGAQAIINATGLGSYHLAADKTVTPLRGALIRVVNDGTKFPKVDEALAVSHDEANGADAEDIVFIVPRNNNVLILGGTSLRRPFPSSCCSLVSIARFGATTRTHSRPDLEQPRNRPHERAVQQIRPRARKRRARCSAACAGSTTIPRV